MGARRGVRGWRKRTANRDRGTTVKATVVRSFDHPLEREDLPHRDVRPVPALRSAARVPDAAREALVRGAGPEVGGGCGMTDDDRTQLRDAQNTEGFALRRAERNMTEVEHDLAGALDTFVEHLADAEQTIEAGVRKQHAGLPPERPLSWRAPAP
jgi:hypothetical protein